MSQAADHPAWAGAAFMAAVMLTGLALLWRLVLSPAARARRQPPALQRWPGSASDLLVFFLLAISGALVLPSIVAGAMRHSAWSSETELVVDFASFQLGMLLGHRRLLSLFGRDRIRRAVPSWLRAIRDRRSRSRC